MMTYFSKNYIHHSILTHIILRGIYNAIVDED